MALNSLKVLLAITVLGVGAVKADANSDYLTIKSYQVEEITHDVLNQEKSSLVYESVYDLPGMPNKSGQLDSQLDNAGKIISTARDLVALGEDVYNLVIKGKPSNKTDYAPISVVPKINGQPADILDTEGWKMPTKRTYEITYENLYGMEVVKFRYSIIFSYGGSYNGTGAYLTAAQIIPESVNTLFGYDFTATMKLGGLQNHGTKASPVAGAILLMEYTVSTIIKANLEVASYHITGRGGFKSL